MQTNARPILMFLCVVAGLSGCNYSKENKIAASMPAAQCQGQPSNSKASAATVALFSGLLQLSCGAKPGVLSGQNAGHGDQINDINQIMGYAQSVKKLAEKTGVVPAVLGLDYEHDRIYSLAQLTSANQTLIGHAKAGGIVTINWSALSPWLNDGRDLLANPGDWLQARTPLNNSQGKAKYVNLTELLTPGSAVHSIWRQRLDTIAAALAQLQAANVPVLWRPMQEMAGTHFWWGANPPLANASGYHALWRDMYQYLTVEKQLNNLLWVYSPEAKEQAGRDVFWAYPGDDVVDVIAPTAYNLKLEIPMYSIFAARARMVGKPLAMAEYGPPVWGAGFAAVLPSAPPSFDARTYGRLLREYPDVAYWVSWHNYSADEKLVVRLSLSDSAFAGELFADPAIINRNQTGFLSKH